MLLWLFISFTKWVWQTCSTIQSTFKCTTIKYTKTTFSSKFIKRGRAPRWRCWSGNERNGTSVWRRNSSSGIVVMCLVDLVLHGQLSLNQLTSTWGQFPSWSIVCSTCLIYNIYCYVFVACWIIRLPIIAVTNRNKFNYTEEYSIMYGVL